MKTEYFLSSFHLAGKPFATEQYLDGHLSYSARELMAWVFPAVLGLCEPLNHTVQKGIHLLPSLIDPRKEDKQAFPPVRQKWGRSQSSASHCQPEEGMKRRLCGPCSQEDKENKGEGMSRTKGTACILSLGQAPLCL